MKKIFIALVAAGFLLEACSPKPEIGKSMGRWTNFGLESMIANKEGGLGYIEVTMNNVINKQPEKAQENADRIMADIQASGLKVWSVHMPYSRTLDISVSDDSARAANVDFLKEMIRVAGTFHPQYLVLHPSSEPISPEEREQRLVNSHASIGELAPAAKEIGAVLCVENLPRTCLGQNAQEMMRLIEGYDEVGLCFDTNHLMYQSHEDYLANVGKGLIKTVHLSDYDFVDECHWVPGQGLTDWNNLWQGIRDNGYDGIMMFECYGEPEALIEARDLILDKGYEPVAKTDSASFASASWEIEDLGNGAISMSTQTAMFSSMQSINVIKYPASEFKTEILHRPGESAGTVSSLSEAADASFALNGCYFNVKELVPTVYMRIGKEVIARTQPAEVYRVDGILAIDQDGSEILIEKSDTSSYEAVSGSWYSAMASGPVLILDGSIVVPEKTGDMADGANVAAMKAEMKAGGGIRTHYSSSQFYDKRHPRSVIGTDDEGYVYYVVIDGRFKGQADGASIYETAYICSLLGMTDAINLDGGGSATLWTDTFGVLNHPYDNKQYDHKGERIVPNLIVAY